MIKLQGTVVQIRSIGGHGLIAKIRIDTVVAPEDKDKPRNLQILCDKTWYPDEKVTITIEKKT